MSRSEGLSVIESRSDDGSEASCGEPIINSPSVEGSIMTGSMPHGYIRNSQSESIVTATDSKSTVHSLIFMPVACLHRVPTEILIIFNIVYTQTDKYLHYTTSLTIGFCWPDRNDVLSHTLFPYTLASVCVRWREIMLLVPKFWTNIVILVDSEFFSFSDVRSQLESSSNLPIDVTISRRTDLFIEREHDENQRVRRITNLLCPHIRHCRTIRYDVIHASSLPAIGIDLHGSAPVLTHLHLESTQCGTSSAALQRFVHPRKDSSFPALRQLAIDGWNFVDLYRNAPQWMSRVGDVSHLCIARYRLSDTPEGRFALRDILQFASDAPDLGFLMLKDLELTESIDDYSHSNDDGLYVFPSLELSHLSSGLTTETLSYISPCIVEDLEITCCPLNGLEFDYLSSEFLTLNDIPSTEDLRQYLTYWKGLHLSISNCPSFDDSVLETLGSTIVGDDGAEELCVSDLFELSLSHCPNFSVSSLRRMVESRQVVRDALLSRSIPVLYSAPRQLGITIFGSAPPTSQEDQDWFRLNVQHHH